MEEKLFNIPKRARFSHVIRNRDFLFLWLDQLMSQLADRLLLYVLLILAYQSTKSNLGVSLPMLSFGASAVVFGPSAGVLVDRWDKKKVMIVSNILRGLLIFAIIPLIDAPVGLLFLMSFAIFSVSQFFSPAEISSIPTLVEKRDLIAANSLFMMTLMAASIIGIGMAAPLTNFLGIKTVLILAASLHLASTLATFMISLKHRHKERAGSLIHLYKELLMGLEFIRRKPLIRYSLTKMFLATSVLAVVSLLAVNYSEQILKIGAANFGYLVLSAGAGMVFGGLFLGRFSHYFRKINLVFAGFLLGGISLLLMSQVTNIPAVFSLVFALGLGNVFIITPLQTILHEKVPRLIRGRVFGVQNMLINSAFTFPVVALGGIADQIGLRVIIVSLGVAVLVVGVFDRFISRFKEA